MILRRDYFCFATFGLLGLIRAGINAYFIYVIYSLGTKYLLKPKIKENEQTDIKFQDIVGIDEYKEELEDIICYLKNRKRFQSYGANIPKGVLLNGPPGCGKTQLARAVAGETNLPFYSFNASDFVQPLYGEGEKIIKRLFEVARRNKKGAVIFIDEIDSLSSRNDFMTSGNSLINQLLTEMDGFGGDDNILIIAATN